MSYSINLLIKEITRDCRVGKEGKVSERLPEFTEHIFKLIENGQVNMNVNELNILFENMLAAQSRGDLIFMADLLDFQLAPKIFSE